MDPILHDKIINEVLHHTQTDPHKRASGLSDFILGAQDGLVNVLGVVLGIAAATNDARIVLVAGLATTFAESSRWVLWRIPPLWQMPTCIKANVNANIGIFWKLPILR